MMIVKYFDKNKQQIEAGMKIQHDDGDVELVYNCGEGDLGVNATNEDYARKHYGENWQAEYPRKCYPLSQFDLSEWVIVK